ncbi:MAG: hypothetical protein LW698_02935 [Planctomycetaceae bacterium]|jgi:hypothetical protein|nr:hypothetical protein [Planctomycetaceae bacterium]
MHDDLRDKWEAAINAVAEAPFLDARRARGAWDRFVADRGETPWTKPLLLLALGSYVDQCQRTFIDLAGALKLRPRPPGRVIPRAGPSGGPRNLGSISFPKGAAARKQRRYTTLLGGFKLAFVGNQ